MTAVREELHFTGGVRARQAGGGWELGPLLREGGIRTVGGIPDEQIGGLGRAIGLTMFGADRISGFNTPLPTRNSELLTAASCACSERYLTEGRITSLAEIARREGKVERHNACWRR